MTGRRPNAVRWLNPLLTALVSAVLLAAALAVVTGYREATETPRIVRYGLPISAARPFRVALLSDTHVGRPDMPPERLRAIVQQVNALRPDLVVLTGDYVKRAPFGLSAIPAQQAIAPLGGLKARLGVFAVLGNNDCASGRGPTIARLLAKAGVRVLRNEVALLPGMALLGTDDVIHCNGNIGPAKIAFAKALKDRKLARWPGPVLLLTHEPVMAHYTPPYVDVVLAGHTHGGQMFPALTGRWAARTATIPRARGLMHVSAEGRPARLLVTSGVGTNNLPLRIGVPPEIVLLTLGR